MLVLGAPRCSDQQALFPTAGLLSSKVTESRQHFLSPQLARLTWWTRNHPRAEPDKEAQEGTPGVLEMPPGGHPAEGAGAENSSQAQEQQGGRLGACWGCVSQRSDGDRHYVMGPQRPHLKATGEGVCEGDQKIQPSLPSHMAIKLFGK